MKAPITKLPVIPNKRYFTIGEVSVLCAVKPHVLRYWEQEFASLRPSKRKGSRRYYQQKDILLVRHIRELLYDKGFTISGARQQLKASRGGAIKQPEQAPLLNEPAVAEQSAPISSTASSSTTASPDFLIKLRQQLESLLTELKE